jgi:hypothetical protein
MRNLENAKVSVEPDDVDREPHEEGVDRRSRAKEESFALLQVVATEEALEPRERRLRQKTPLTDRSTVFATQAPSH